MSDSERILVVDDDPLSLRMMADQLTASGYRVSCAQDGVQALEQLRQTPTDLLLLDLVMPRMSGLEVCRIVKASSETFIPIILITHQGDVESKVQGLKLGADDYLVKPVNPLELQARVGSMLRIKALQDKVVARRQELEALSVTDELTGLFNHRAMQQRLRDEFQRASRYNEALAVIMLDIDHFKTINDTYGHVFGDRVVAGMGAILGRCVRDVDICARYGGDEFMAILPSTQFTGALTVAERIWRAVANEPIHFRQETLRMTISVGVAFYPNKRVTSPEDLVHQADQALYQAKREGRNRICLQQHLNYMIRAEPPTADGPQGRIVP